MVNNIVIEGNLGANAEIIKVSDNLSIVRFSVAHNYKIQDEKITLWLRCEAFRATEDAANKTAAVLKKGRRVTVIGQLLDDSYTRQTGEQVKSMKIRVERFFMGDSPTSATETTDTTKPAPATTTATANTSNHNAEADLPF